MDSIRSIFNVSPYNPFFDFFIYQGVKVYFTNQQNNNENNFSHQSKFFFVSVSPT